MSDTPIKPETGELARPRFKLIKTNGEETGLPEYSESEALIAMIHLSTGHGVKTRMVRVDTKI